MGSTGHSLISTSRSGNVNNETFGIPGAVNYTGGVPSGKGIEKPGSNKITLKVRSNDAEDIIFQFKITKDNRLSINGFDPNKPESRAHLIVSATNPSIDAAAMEGTKTDKSNATKLHRMFSKSQDIKEGQLAQISYKLLNAKRSRGRR